jgi:hypothetical protein
MSYLIDGFWCRFEVTDKSVNVRIRFRGSVSIPLERVAAVGWHRWRSNGIIQIDTVDGRYEFALGDNAEVAAVEVAVAAGLPRIFGPGSSDPLVVGLLEDRLRERRERSARYDNAGASGSWSAANSVLDEAPRPGSAPAAVTAPTGPVPASLSTDLASVAKLHQHGQLTDEEFAAAKKKLLGDAIPK